MSAGQFWAQFSNTPDCLALNDLQESIRRRPLEPLVMDPRQLQGVYCLAMFQEDNHYYRARVEAVMKMPTSTPTVAPTMMAKVRVKWKVSRKGIEGEGLSSQPIPNLGVSHPVRAQALPV